MKAYEFKSLACLYLGAVQFVAADHMQAKALRHEFLDQAECVGSVPTSGEQADLHFRREAAVLPLASCVSS
jgi:hypothetical protein